MHLFEQLGCCIRPSVVDSETADIKSGAENSDAIPGSSGVVPLLPSDTGQEAKMMLASSESAGLQGLRAEATDLDKYIYLRHLQEAKETVFYKLLMNNAEEILPYVYTPTVGEACLKYSELPIKTRGLVIRPEDKGQILQKLRSWTDGEVRVIVVTDGERILGLGDLGYNGMGISEGKILLYTVIAGVDPDKCMPVCIDVGTENEVLLHSNSYKGIRQHRIRGSEYYSLLDEFMGAVRSLNKHILLQFEDFGNKTAFELLERYRTQQCCFNDDIQGTACIALAGLLSALRITGKSIGEQRILFLGAGEAGTGIGQLIASSIAEATGVSQSEALQHCFYVDRAGLVCKSRLSELAEHKKPFAHDVPFEKDFLSALKVVKPTMIVGVSTSAGAFNEQVVRYMAEINERPIIFPLSNPTSLSEVTYEDAFRWTSGKVVFASGSPFPPLQSSDGRTHTPAQANNAYVFGPIGMAALLTSARTISDEVFVRTAGILAQLTPEQTLEEGLLFPSFTQMKTLVVPLISGIAQFMVESGLGTAPEGLSNWDEYVRKNFYVPGAVPANGAAVAGAAAVANGAAVAGAVAVASGAAVVNGGAGDNGAAGDELQLAKLRQLDSDINRYIYLRKLQEQEPNAFWHLLVNHPSDILPFVYTPTVGEACQKYSELPIQTHGLFLSLKDKGGILEKLRSWPEQDIRVIVVTDGERILGLGDLGYGGMGISEGKITLYTVVAGVDPRNCLPVCLDVGTNREELLSSATYKGLLQKRPRGEPYDKFIDEFMAALRAWQPHTLLQFEDFGNSTAFHLLEKYRSKQCCFNDDIQGTACIALAGLLNALRITGKPLREQTIIFLGAGEAGTGIGQLISMAMVRFEDYTLEEARKHCFFIDTKGLVCASRTDLQEHKKPFAHDVPYQDTLLAAVKALRPTMLIGVSTQHGAFSPEVLEAMALINERPIIFPLSNPTDLAECTFQEAYTYTGGRAVFASGSPFPPLKANDGSTIEPAQANNAYVFPTIGMAAILTKATTIPDEVFLQCSKKLSDLTDQKYLDEGVLFPPFDDMRSVSPQLIAQLAEFMVADGLGVAPSGLTNWLDYVQSQMFRP